MADPTAPRGTQPEKDLIASNLLAFLRENVSEGQEAEVAINPELRAIVVHLDGELLLSCTFDELLKGSTGARNYN